MNYFYFLLLPALVCSLSLKERFDDWVIEFDHSFLDDIEKQQVFETWVSNDKYIDMVNSKNLSFTLGHNYFSGMNEDEYKKYMGLKPISLPSIVDSIKNKVCKVKCLRDKETSIIEKIHCYEDCGESDYITELDSEVNWVKKGGVTDVKNQGQCGSCWSFSTTGALEGAYYVKYGKLPSFSEQQLVDCDNFKNGGKDHGCNGGLMDNAFSWISKNEGLCSEEDYPYVSGTTKQPGVCDNTCSVIENSEVQSFVDVDKNSDDAFMAALMMQPVSIAIEADQKSFQLYKSGVFTDTCGTNLDHGVLAVGYGTENNIDYYLVKNSWGTTWGDNGYIKLARGSEYNNGKGQCGLLMQASYPEL